MFIRLTVNTESPMLLRTYLRKYAGISAHMLRRLKTVPDGITRGGQQLHVTQTVSPQDVICLHLPEQPSADPNPALDVPVLWQSPQLLVCNKPAQMPVHGSMRHRCDTLANWHAARFPQEGFHVLGRLDRDTTGLCLIARTLYAANALSGKVQKVYFALVQGILSGSGTVDAPIARVTGSVIARCVRPDGQRAVTHYTALAQSGGCTLLRLSIDTGRTHQIRVHMSYIGHPLLGDALYGGDCAQLHTHALHCGALTFPDPDSGETVRVTAPLPPAWQIISPKFDECIAFL